MYRSAAIALLLAGVRAVAADEKCFCPLEDDGASRACAGSPYKKISIGSLAKDRCQELCAEENFEEGTDKCKGFARLSGSSDNNCLLYRSEPELGTEEGVCFGLTGKDDGFVELPRKLTGGCGGVCGAPIYSGKRRCDFGDIYEEPFCNPPGSYLKARSLQECKDWCEGRGILCQGFDYDEGKGNVCARRDPDLSKCGISCYERRYKPTVSRGLTSSTRDDWTDEFCHARVCDCGGLRPPAREIGFPEQKCLARTPFPTPPPTTPPTSPPVAPPTPNCDNDRDWEFVTKKGKTQGCNWVGKNSSKRCGKVGTSGGQEKVASEACPSKCNDECF